jgi:hypothetical protein
MQSIGIAVAVWMFVVWACSSNEDEGEELIQMLGDD